MYVRARNFIGVHSKILLRKRVSVFKKYVIAAKCVKCGRVKISNAVYILLNNWICVAHIVCIRNENISNCEFDSSNWDGLNLKGGWQFESHATTSTKHFSGRPIGYFISTWTIVQANIITCIFVCNWLAGWLFFFWFHHHSIKPNQTHFLLDSQVCACEKLINPDRLNCICNNQFSIWITWITFNPNFAWYAVLFPCKNCAFIRSDYFILFYGHRDITASKCSNMQIDFIGTTFYTMVSIFFV